MKMFRQIGAVTAMNFRSLPQRVSTSLVVVIGIAGVVAVLVSVLAMSTGLSGSWKASAQVDGGNGHSGKRSPELHFGLGDSEGIVKVEIRWRDQQGQVHHEYLDLKPGRYTIVLASAKSGGLS